MGHDLVLMSRDARPLADRFPGARVVAADLLEPATLAPALDGVAVAYYLAHSMGAGERGFAERDRRQPATSRWRRHGRDRPDRLSRRPGRRRRGPLAPPGQPPRGGAELAAHGVPVTEFRAAVIIGSGSASFENLRHLTERLPIDDHAPVGGDPVPADRIRDVLDYLMGALEHPATTGVVEIGGPDVLSYGDMMPRMRACAAFGA